MSEQAKDWEAILSNIVKISDKHGWNVTFSECSKLMYFQRYSPAGQDFMFEIALPDKERYNKEECEQRVIKEIDEYYQSFDVSSEAYLWLDSDGHGTNGAPHDMKDVYDDFCVIDKELRELKEALIIYVLSR